MWTKPHEFRAKDISRGGVFIRTDSEPEIFSDVQLAILLPWGGDLRLRARIVHIMPPAKAAPLGVDAGLGIEFQDPSPTEKESIERLVIWARDSDPTRCVPKRLQPAVVPQVNPMVSYVLEAIDGVRSVDEIADHLELEGTATESVLIQLSDLGLVDLGGPEAQERIATRAGLNANPRGGPATASSTRPSAQEPVACSLSTEKRAAIDTIHARLAGDHYQVLAVLPRADREQIRSAYFSLSKQFHPDAYKAHHLGPFQSKVFDIFDRLTEAYATLSNPNSRQQYDDYLRALLLGHAEASLSPPGATAPPRQPSAALPSVPTRAVPAPRVSGAPVVTSQVPPTIRYETGNANRLPNTHSGPPARMAASAQPPAASGQPPAPHTSARAPAPRGEEGHGDLVRSYLEQATKAFESGDLKASARLLDLLDALEWNRPQLRATYEELERKVYAGLASTFEQQAQYETKQQRWKQAARSWLKVCRGRPNDAECHRAAAEALLAQKADLRKARDLAQRAVELSPKDARARRVLGHVFLEAGMHLNARRELEVAAGLNRGDQETKILLSKIPGLKA
jgi:curved DNA-binding protein CbpA/Tfp pilus assembly protein PilZ